MSTGPMPKRKEPPVTTESPYIIETFLSAASAVGALLDRRLGQAAAAEPEIARLGSSAVRIIMLAERRPGISPSSLAAMLRQESHSVSGLLNRLEDVGLITRERDRKDRRVVHVFATAHGRFIAERAAAIFANLSGDLARELRANEPFLALTLIGMNAWTADRSRKADER